MMDDDGLMISISIIDVDLIFFLMVDDGRNSIKNPGRSSGIVSNLRKTEISVRTLESRKGFHVTGISL